MKMGLTIFTTRLYKPKKSDTEVSMTKLESILKYQRCLFEKSPMISRSSTRPRHQTKPSTEASVVAPTPYSQP